MNKQTAINHQTAPFGKQMLADVVFCPILFSTPMVEAILKGRKTQTRRIFKVNKTPVTHQQESVFWDVEMGEAVYNSMGGQSWWSCPYGNIGDILWVRETWQMPKSACRLFLEITNIKIERLQDISANDIKAEGVSYTIDYYPNLLDLWQNLWGEINGQQSWDENPFVWVVSFKVVNCPSGFR